jgi:hypothetical protein
MKTLFNLVRQVSSRRWYNTVPLSLPIFMISGSMDPVGDYSKGVNEVYKKLKKSGHKNVTLKLYEDARHEILNETNREEVYSDIIAWLDERVAIHDEGKSAPIIVPTIDEIFTLPEVETPTVEAETENEKVEETETAEIVEETTEE